jgi:hypothetical protein
MLGKNVIVVSPAMAKGLNRREISSQAIASIEPGVGDILVCRPEHERDRGA